MLICTIKLVVLGTTPSRCGGTVMDISLLGATGALLACSSGIDDIATAGVSLLSSTGIADVATTGVSLVAAAEISLPSASRNLFAILKKG